MSSKIKHAPIGMLSLLMLAGAAHAQVAPPVWYPQQYPAHVSIQAAPSTELEVIVADAPAGSAAVTRCTEYCDFWAWPGRYTLYSVDHISKQRRQLSLRVKHSARYWFQAGDDDARTTGLALGIGGSVALVTGFVLMMPAIFSQMCEDTNCTSPAERDAATAGLVVLVAGAITAPIGWIMYGSNRTRLKQFDDGRASSMETRSQVRVGVVGVGLGGLGLGALGTF
jgi:hypothetical protein